MYEKLPLFENLSPIEIKKLNVIEKQYSAGERIINYQDKIDHFGYVLEGRIEVYSNDVSGNTNIIASGTSGFMFGESLASLGRNAFPVSIKAITLCKILLIPSKVLVNENINPVFLRNILKIQAKTNLEYRRKITILEQRKTSSKIMTYLLSESKMQNKNPFEIPFDRQGLADFLAVDRSAMSQEIGKLVKQGIIETRKNKFYIKNSNAVSE